MDGESLQEAVGLLSQLEASSNHWRASQQEGLHPAAAASKVHVNSGDGSYEWGAKLLAILSPGLAIIL